MTEAENNEFEAFCRRWRPWLVSMLRGQGMCEPDAEDAAQQALIALWQNRARVRNPLGFLGKVGPRELAKLSRTGRRATLVADTDQRVDSQAVSSRPRAELVCERLLALLVREALLTLPPREREVMAGRYDGYSNSEIGTAFGLRPVTVRTNLHRARNYLTTAIEADEWDLHPRVLRRAYQERHAGNLSPAGARPVITQSWRRSHSREVKVDRAALTVPCCDDLEDRRRASPLYAVWDTVGVWLTDIASRNGLMATVSDGSGVVLFRDGDHALLRRTERDGFCESAYWIEESAGTNAIGVAMRTGYPEVVITAEHWIAEHEDLVCAAAPVHSPRDNELVGLLNLTGRWPASHKDMLRLIDEAARQARRQLASAVSAQHS